MSERPEKRLLGSTHRIPQLECHVQIARKAVTMLEPFLALRFHFCPRLWRCGIRLQGQIIKVGTDSNSKPTVVVVDEGEPILRQITSHWRTMSTCSLT